MCGIAGIYDLTCSGRADSKTVDRMAGALAHRGPDGEGRFCWPPESPQLAMGVRRLSIIDLAGGDQPIFNEDHTLALIFNGEISNHVELRAELARRGHAFRSRSDTETIVHLYEDYSLELFTRLRGMYAFALWDARAGRLILAADPVGVKPLYLAQQNGRLYFASEVKALMTVDDLPRRVNLPAVDTYMTFGYMIGTETLYEGITRLAPGHALVLEGSRSYLRQHWSSAYPSVSDRPTNEEDIIAETRERLTDAVRLQMRSDVPLGLFLSGGIDSASLLALMTRCQGRPVETFTVGYQQAEGTAHPDDETTHARQSAAFFGATHRDLSLSAEDWWNTLPAYLYHHDEPNANPSAVSMMALARMASRHVKVVLNGLGGDEVFCGYPSHRVVPRRLDLARRLRRLAPWAMQAAATGLPWAAAEEALPFARRLRVAGALLALLIEQRGLFTPPDETLRRAISFDGHATSEGHRDRLYSPQLRQVIQLGDHKARAFAEILQSTRTDDPADAVQSLWIHTWLPGNGLLSLDKVTMAHSLEARVPFFDPPLMTFAMSIPSRIRLRAEKHVLREAVRDIVPPSVLRRRKKPFGTPIRSWFDNDLAERVQDILLDPRCLGRGWFDSVTLESLVLRHFRKEADHTELIFRLLLLELWLHSSFDAVPGRPAPQQVRMP